MDLKDERRIAASREAVFAALNDPEVLRSCIPGCETLEKVSDHEMNATVSVKVGPIKTRFQGRVELSNIDPPFGYTIMGEGSGGSAGAAKGDADVTLLEDGGATILRYAAKAQVVGKLAQLGGRLIDSTAKALAGQFFDKFAAVVGGDAEPVGVGSPSQSAETLVPLWAIIGAVVLFATLLLVLLQRWNG